MCLGSITLTYAKVYNILCTWFTLSWDFDAAAFKLSIFSRLAYCTIVSYAQIVNMNK